MKKCCDPNLQIFMLKTILYHNVFSYLVQFNWKMEFYIDFLQVLTYCYFPNFSLIEKCYLDYQQRFMSTIRNQYWNFIFFYSFFKKHKKCFYFNNFDGMWLVNEVVLNFSTPIKYAKAQFNPMILSRVIEYTTYYNYRQTDRHFS